MLLFTFAASTAFLMLADGAKQTEAVGLNGINLSNLNLKIIFFPSRILGCLYACFIL